MGFNNAASYNSWDEKDKRAWFRLAVIGPSAQILWGMLSHMRKWSKHYENDTEQKGLKRNTELSYNADAAGLDSRLGSYVRT